MADVEIKQHDKRFSLVIGLSDAGDDLAPPATFEQVESWKVFIKRSDGTLFTDEAPTVLSANDSTLPHTAVLIHQWTDEEVALPTYGLQIEAEATWPDGSTQSFPTKGYLTVAINPDLG